MVEELKSEGEFTESDQKAIEFAADRKSTRLNLQSHVRISYAVFCLKKKKKNISK